MNHIHYVLMSTVPKTGRRLTAKERDQLREVCVIPQGAIVRRLEGDQPRVWVPIDARKNHRSFPSICDGSATLTDDESRADYRSTNIIVGERALLEDRTAKLKKLKASSQALASMRVAGFHSRADLRNAAIAASPENMRPLVRAFNDGRRMKHQGLMCDCDPCRAPAGTSQFP